MRPANAGDFPVITGRTFEESDSTDPMALGAQVMDVLGMVTGQGVKLAGIGLAVGLAASLAVTRLMTSLLFSVRPGAPMVFAAVAVTLGAVTLLASLIPSIRALRVRPADALRYE